MLYDLKRCGPQTQKILTVSNLQTIHSHIQIMLMRYQYIINNQYLNFIFWIGLDTVSWGGTENHYNILYHLLNWMLTCVNGYILSKYYSVTFMQLQLSSTVQPQLQTSIEASNFSSGGQLNLQVWNKITNQRQGCYTRGRMLIKNVACNDRTYRILGCM